MTRIIGLVLRAARLRAAFACLLALVAVGGTYGGAATAPRPGSGPQVSAAISTGSYCADAEEQAFLSLINRYRAQYGLGPLTLTQTLGAAAEHHSLDMANRNYVGHTLSDGTTWSQNMVNHGYTYNTYRGENIAAGNSSASATFEQWKNSSGHRANMLSGNFKAIGIGRAYNSGSTYKWYWTTTFGGVADGAAALCGSSSSTSTTSGTPYTIVRSGRTSGSNSSAYAYDRNAGTAWITNYSSTPRSYAYVWFDLGGKKSIGSIQWMFQKYGYADSVRIQISNDRSTWTTVARVGNAPAGSWQKLATSTSARYVRFYFANPNRDRQLGSLAEVKITS